ncbi:hypothetical protein FJZ18_04015 [Candidatus Pacearchaeota archaeon]|nr:hypothetical protein [Candidatus Pacearchaeota archaeon]
MSLRILAGFGSYNSAADYYLSTLIRDQGHRIIRAPTLKMMLTELGISPQDVPPATPKSYFDWVIMGGSFDGNSGDVSGAKWIFSLLEEEIMDGRVGFRMFTGDKYEKINAERENIPVICWREMSKLMEFTSQLQDESAWAQKYST